MAKLAIFFPGIGYTCDKPLLYYSRKLADQAGYECKLVGYALQGNIQIKGNREKMEEAFRVLYAGAEECLSDVAWQQYEEVLFISKSIGTVIASAYAKKTRDVLIRHVLYTPLEYTFGFQPADAVGFIGTNDSWCNPSEVLRLAKEQGIPMHVYEDTDHSLEKGDALTDLDTIRDVMYKTREFICAKLKKQREEEACR